MTDKATGSYVPTANMRAELTNTTGKRAKHLSNGLGSCVRRV